jgi:hypothetical protein
MVSSFLYKIIDVKIYDSTREIRRRRRSSTHLADPLPEAAVAAPGKCMGATLAIIEERGRYASKC